ncbi:MAG: HEPN domain-containing protein [Pseudomonadota bacterium]
MPDNSYEKHFVLVDDYIQYTEEYVSSITDGFIKSRFTGFLSVNAVTVFELCIKEIFINFSEKKNNVFGCFVENHFQKLNGRIKISDIKSLANKFGDKYSLKFDKLLCEAERKSLNNREGSIKSSYGNIIEWRHQFAHKGIMPVNATYEEAKNSYVLGKTVIIVLFKAMKR